MALQVQGCRTCQPRIVNRLHGWLNPCMRNPRIPRANHKFHSIERWRYQWEKELISYFACAFYLWLQRQCSLVMFLTSSCLPLTQNQSWRESSRFTENASPSHLALSRVPPWFWIRTENWENCYKHGWLITEWLQSENRICQRAIKMELLGPSVKKWLILGTGHHFFSSSY